jgi:Ca-activated chloride channel family protein
MTASLTLSPRPERHLIRPGGSLHIDFLVRAPARSVDAARPALGVALVLDRSGSMHGTKIATARDAASAVVAGLDDRDRVAVVVFDDRIDVLQPATPATAEVRASIRAALHGVAARGSTALHEGWLTGCREIASDGAPPADDRSRLARCFLLTDGLANVGLVDPEQIASQAADIRRSAGVSTSTFGIGLDYAEQLLGPMAVAGAGQFHHLRGPADIRQTFTGELAELLTVVASGVRLELRTDADVSIDVVGQYRAEQRPGVAVVDLGDLIANDERHVVVRFGLSAAPAAEVAERRVACRVSWVADGVARTSEWVSVTFRQASQQAYDAEARDPVVMHWVGLQHADRARREALDLSRAGNAAQAREHLQAVAQRIAEYADADPDLLEAQRELSAIDDQVAAGPVAPAFAKEVYAAAQRRSRGQRDLRES